MILLRLRVVVSINIYFCVEFLCHLINRKTKRIFASNNVLNSRFYIKRYFQQFQFAPQFLLSTSFPVFIISIVVSISYLSCNNSFNARKQNNAPCYLPVQVLTLQTLYLLDIFPNYSVGFIGKYSVIITRII